MTLPLQVRSYTTDLYSQALSSIWQFYDRVRDPSYALSQDVDAWEVMLRDPKIYQGVQERLHAVAGPNWRVFPFNNSKDERDVTLAKIAEDAFRRIPHLADARLRLAQAVFRGQASELMTGKRQYVELGRTGKRWWWLPTGFTQIDPRRFTIRPIREVQEDGTVRVRGELYMSTVPMQSPYSVGEDPRPTAMPSATLQNYRKVEHPEWFIRIIYNDEEARLGYGRGILDCLYFYAWAKTVLMREGLQGVERWSQGIVVGSIDADRLGATDNQTMAKERKAMQDALTAMRARHVFVKGKHDEVEVITGGGEGHQIVSSMRDYIDDCIMAVCTGAVLMSSKSNAGSLGSLSRDEVGRDTQRGVILYDQNKIDEDMTTDAINLFIRMNWKNLSELTLTEAGTPSFRTVGAKHVDPDRAASRFAQVASLQAEVEVREDEFFEQLDLTPPGPDDRTVVLGRRQGGEEPRGPGGLFAPGQQAESEEMPQRAVETSPESMKAFVAKSAHLRHHHALLSRNYESLGRSGGAQRYRHRTDGHEAEVDGDGGLKITLNPKKAAGVVLPRGKIFDASQAVETLDQLHPKTP